MSRTISSLLCVLVLISCFGSFSLADKPAKPNIIIIFCDDLGYNDVGAYGSKLHRTPNIDQMASEGRRFTDFYVTSGVCSPSRSSLMTGCYPKRIGLHQNESNGWVLFPGNKRGLNPSEITIAEVLKEQGYNTACIGKWHLGDQPEYLPTRQGFDYYFGIPFSNDMGHTDRPTKRYPPLPLLRMEEVIEEEPDQRYLTQRYTKEAIQFITKNKENPFFLYMPHTMPHWPQYASENFDGKSKNGKWGDTVEEIDWSVGKLFETLKDLNLDENTITVFMSDNGGATQHGASNLPLKAGKGTTWEGGHRIPMIIHWPNKIAAGSECDQLAITMDLLPTFAKLVGGSAPQDRVIDGQDIWPLIASKEYATTPHDAYYYYFRGTLHAIRSGDWKLFVSRKGRQPKKQDANFKPELYNLRDDIGETNNVAAANPKIVKSLMKFVEQAREDLGDDGIGRPGKNLRKPGHIENAVPLTSN